MNSNKKSPSSVPEGANIAGVPTDGSDNYPVTEPDGGVEIPSSDGNGEYIPRHLTPGGDRGDYVRRPDGSTVAPNGAVIRNPWSDQPEIKPDNKYTEEKEDLNLLIM